MKNFVILDASEVSLIDFGQIIETSADTLRYSVDGTKTFVKYRGTKPSFLNGKTEYSYEEILAILAGPEWSSDEL